ncbi:hypothetical protein ENE74_08610 [Sphingobium algorifonticola]|uniref:FMN-dependent dehydrogenase domain-containing protein n=1 Tax=Sphingobium algorifonticola TaxID=2008318 RepID=A0A437J9S8_9SPHN|nr:hypothetical protein ENE74_08610 [Sphingobium algorifonticola]
MCGYCPNHATFIKDQHAGGGEAGIAHLLRLAEAAMHVAMALTGAGSAARGMIEQSGLLMAAYIRI